MKQHFFRIISSVILIALMLSATSCNKNSDDKKITIVCTGFSQYDFVKEILGDKKDNFNVEYLFGNGADVHSFESDISYDVKIKILSSDILIYNGGESDGWIEDILKDKSMNQNCKKISLVEAVGKNSLIYTQGDHTHDSSCEDDHSHGDFDEHIWLSLKNAKKICEYISQAIIESDLENEDTYKENVAQYCEKLNNLHLSFEEEVSKINLPYVVVADRFPFIYLFNDYKISYCAAFSGCTSETEANYENVVRLCNAIEDHNVKYIFVLEKSNSNISNTVKSATKSNLEILSINSLQSVSNEEIENGLTYFSVMKQNFDSIKKAL